MNESFAGSLISEFKKLNISPDVTQTEQFTEYYELLCEWNKKINLTAVTAPKDVIRRHFADSLAPMRLLADWRCAFAGASVMDVGTGAGFPGIPLKIMNPDMRLTLLDSLEKRTLFLKESVTRLGLSDVKVVHRRAEDAGRDETFRERYDLCVSRAVAGLSTLSEYCLPFVRVGGVFLSYKSAGIQDELTDSEKAIARLGGCLKDVMMYKTPDGGRSLIIIEKKEKTPDKYPRKAGLPGKRPIK